MVSAEVLQTGQRASPPICRRDRLARVAIPLCKTLQIKCFNFGATLKDQTFFPYKWI